MACAMSGIFKQLHDWRRFDTWREVDHLEKNISELLRAGDIEEISVESPESIMQTERWFRDVATGEVFRYQRPEFPARGIWEKVR